jgi:hypothetical protein
VGVVGVGVGVGVGVAAGVGAGVAGGGVVVALAGAVGALDVSPPPCAPAPWSQPASGAATTAAASVTALLVDLQLMCFDTAPKNRRMCSSTRRGDAARM